METGSKTSLKHPVTPYARGYILLDTVNRDILDSYTIWSENLSLTLEKKWCHAELGSASCFCPEGETLKQVQDDKSQKFQISLARLLIKLDGLNRHFPPRKHVRAQGDRFSKGDEITENKG
jgi:hypothetical protein